jgi:hypothetical protein
MLNAVTICWATSSKIDLTILSFCRSWSLESYFFNNEEWIKKVTLYSDIRSAILNSGSSCNGTQNETDVAKFYILYLKHFLMC